MHKTGLWVYILLSAFKEAFRTLVNIPVMCCLNVTLYMLIPLLNLIAITNKPCHSIQIIQIYVEEKTCK